MKLRIFIYLFWVNIFTEGAPDDYEQRLQPRNLGDWFYGRNLDPDQSEPNENDNILNDHDETKVIPLDKVGPDDQPEPIENLFDELKKKANKESMDSKSIYKEDKNITSLLEDLNKTITDAPTKLAKIFVNKTWRIFDIGALGSTRRTKSFTQFFTPVYSHGAINQGNTAMHPSLYSNVSPTNRNSLKAYNLPIAQLTKQTSFNNDLGIDLSVSEANKDKAADFYNSETPEEMMLKIAESLEKHDLNNQEMFYIILALDQLYDLSYKFENDETKIDLIRLIIDVGNDERFDKIFGILKSSKNREDRSLWHFFQNSRTVLWERIESIERRIREKEVTKEALPENCFITGPPKEVSERGTGDQKVTLITYHTMNPESNDDNYKFCIEDDSEAEADKILMLKNKKSFNDLLRGIKLTLNSSMWLMDTEKKWLVILKLYKMLEKLNTESDREDDKKNITQMMTQLGNDRKFVRMFESLKAAKGERFHKIWDSFKNNSQKEDDTRTWRRYMTGYYN